LKEYRLPNWKIKLFLFVYRVMVPMSIFTVLLIAFIGFWQRSLMKEFLFIDVLLILCFKSLFILFSAITSFSVSLKEEAISVKIRNLKVEIMYNLIDEVKILEDKFYDREIVEISLKSNIVISKYFFYLGLMVGFGKKTKESKQIIVFSVENSRALYEELKRIVEKDNG